ncbi:hypothetical protein D1P53_000773 [Cryptococcus gattii VGV]|nr:hypothetical protein D1P53_000773 [Cryptococcus gattii VGV]
MIDLSAPSLRESSSSPSGNFSPSKHAFDPSQPITVTPLEPLAASPPGGNTSWALNSYPSYIPYSSHSIIDPSPFPTSISFINSFSMSQSRQINDTYSHGMTPTTATGQWTQSPAPDNSFISSPLAGSIAFQRGLTGLSPMFATFNTTSTPNASRPITSHSTNSSRPMTTGGFSASSAILSSPNRHRSSTLVTLSSPSPMMPSFNTYPYPSPHISYPSTPSYVSGRNNFRQPSIPAVSEKRIFHPSPAGTASATGVELAQLPFEHVHEGIPHFGSSDVLGGIGLNMGMGNHISLGMFPQMSTGCRLGSGQEFKLPRFKPTKEQLKILIKAYEENKNPDGPTREALAKKLGPDVRPKTLQIWFQNRRSKSRAKERNAANVQKPLQINGPKVRSLTEGRKESDIGPTGPTSGGQSGTKEGKVNITGLYDLIHDDDPNLSILPITVISIAKWTRFLTPGTSNICPDLAASIRFPSTSISSDPSSLLFTLHLYVLDATIFRIDIPLSASVISNFQAANNPSVDTDAVAVRFELGRSKVRFACWIAEEGTGWKETGDFTGGEAGSGAKVELTGPASVLLPAFSDVQRLLANTDHLTPISSFPISRPIFIHPRPITAWRFPANANTQFHSDSNSTSTPSSSSPVSPDIALPLPLSTVNADTDMMFRSHQGQQATIPALAAHQRQRSFSQPIFPTFTLIGDMLPIDPSLSSTALTGETAGASLNLHPFINTTLPASAQNSIEPSPVSFLRGSSHSQKLVTGSFDGSARGLLTDKLCESQGDLSDSTSLTSHINKSGLFEESSTKVSIPAFLSSPKGIVEEKDP